MRKIVIEVTYTLAHDDDASSVIDGLREHYELECNDALYDEAFSDVQFEVK